MALIVKNNIKVVWTTKYPRFLQEDNDRSLPALHLLGSFIYRLGLAMRKCLGLRRSPPNTQESRERKFQGAQSHAAYRTDRYIWAIRVKINILSLSTMLLKFSLIMNLATTRKTSNYIGNI